MKWEQLIKSQAKDYKVFLKAYKDSLDLLNKDIILLLGAHTEKSAPQNIQDKITRDRSAWEHIWGINGLQITNLRDIHQKELNAFFINHQKQNEL